MNEEMTASLHHEWANREMQVSQLARELLLASVAPRTQGDGVLMVGPSISIAQAFECAEAFHEFRLARWLEAKRSHEADAYIKAENAKVAEARPNIDAPLATYRRTEVAA